MLTVITIGLLCVIAIVSAIPAVGLAVAIAKGTVTVPLILRETIIVVAIGGGAVAGTAGAVATASKISKKRRSAFIAFCACGEWFIADALSELYLEHYGAIEKILFKGSASLAFALAGGLWSEARWLRRSAAIVLFLAPSLLVALKILASEVPITIHGFRLYVLLAAPAALMGLYITLYSFGILEED